MAEHTSRGRLAGVLSDRRIVVVLLLSLIAAAYGTSLRNELVFDERIFIERDVRVRTLAVDRIFFEALWSQGEGDPHLHQYYRPFQLLPLALSYAAFGEAAWPSHLLSLALHALNSLLVWSLLRRLLARADVAAALAMLFAVHPGYSEAVLWVSDVAGLGAALCVLAIVRLHVGSPERGATLLVPLLLFGALMFKESGVVAVVLMAGWDLIGAADRGIARLWRGGWRYLALVMPLALYAVLRWRALGGALPGIESVPLTGAEMALNAVALLPRFAATLLWPFDLNMYHDFDPVRGIGESRFVLGAALAVGWAVGFAAALRRDRVVAFGMLWAAAAAAPHLLVRWPQLNVFAERYLYLPMVGVVIAIGAQWCRIAWPRAARRVAIATLALLLTLFVVVDVRRAAEWRDELTIYGKTLTQSPRAELIRLNLGVRLLELKRYDEGIAVLEALQRLDPDWPETRHNLGLLYLGNGDVERATQAFEQAAARDPFKPATLLNLGYLYDRAGRREDAVRTYLRLTRRAPRFADAWFNLAAIAAEGGQFANARFAAERVLELRPADAAARRLVDDAAAAARLAETPGRSADETVARCEAAKRQADAGAVDESILTLRMAAWLDEAAPMPHHYLANLYFLRGRVAEALAAEREALRRAPDNQLFARNVDALENAARRTP